MKEYLIQIVQFVLQECLVPAVISVFCFWIQYKVYDRKEKRNAAPNMFLLTLNGKEEIRVNETKIKKSKYIIAFHYQEPKILDRMKVADRVIRFEEITYKELLSRVDKCEMVLLGFENIGETSLLIKHVVAKQEEFFEIDEKVVPSLIDEDTNYCLICRKEDVPISLRGRFLEHPVEYVIKGRNGTIGPRVRSKSAGKG